MKGQTILSSIFLGLTLPTLAFANVLTPSSPSLLNHEQLNKLETVEIAQRYISPQDVSSRLYSSESRILDTAREYSGNQVNWKDISVEVLSDQRIKLNCRGKVPVGGRLVKNSNIRVGLNLKRDSQGNFRFVGYDFSVWGGTVPRRVRSEAEKKLRNLPNHFPRFQQVLDSILA